MSVIQELPLVSTVAIGLSAAFVCGMIANKFKLSPLVGYILAGILIGPHTPGFIADIHTAEQLSEIGIVLLMFGVGLHFSIHDFMEVRKIAATGALLRIAIVTGISYLAASAWGWSAGASVIFGLCLSVASTVVLLRTFEEHHLVNTITGKITIGWLIVEDIAMILAMILIPALVAGTAVNADGESSSLAMQIGTALGKVALFAIVMVVAGKRVLPWLLSAVMRTGSRELFTLAAFCMAMGIAFGAAILFGVSLALGAFFAGMMIRESDLNHEVSDRLLPFQDAFAVLFFVAVGMLFDPSILVESPLRVIITVLIIIVLKIIVTYAIVRMFRYPGKTAMKIAVGLAQIGEFSFILIALGASLGIMPVEERNLILAGALISIALNPVLFNAARKLFKTEESAAPLEDDKLAHLEQGEQVALRNLVLLIGYGDVGNQVAQQIAETNADLVILDGNREKIEHLRAKGYHAVAGDATNREMLEEAQIHKAHAVLITVPDPFEVQAIISQIKSLQPSAQIFVRSRNVEETTLFRSGSADMIVSGPEEIARRMIAALPAA